MGSRKEPLDTHNVVYMALLAALAFFYIIGAVMFLLIVRSSDTPPESRWVFQMTLFMEFAYVAAMVATLILRGVSSKVGRVATLAMNIILLPLIPFGTALGIYGLWKVDKVRKQAELPG